MTAPQNLTLAQIVAALSVTYTDTGVLTWLVAGNRGAENGESPFGLLAQHRIDDVAELVRLIGDADPSDFTITECR